LPDAKTENSLGGKKEIVGWITGKISDGGSPVFVLISGQAPITSMQRQQVFVPFLYRRPGIWAFFGLSAFWRINNLHVLNTPAQFDPD
jgi:hypothetical protein